MSKEVKYFNREGEEITVSGIPDNARIVRNELYLVVEDPALEDSLLFCTADVKEFRDGRLTVGKTPKKTWAEE